MTNGIPDRDPVLRDMEQLWDAKLRQARERYCRAAAESFRCFLESSGQGAEAPADLTAVRQAEALAFAEYCRVLAVFTELTAMGQLPIGEPSNVVTMPPRPG